MLDTGKVLVGAPDQRTTGAVLRGPVMTDIPADIDALETALATFEDAGYVSEDGVTVTTEFNTSDKRDWSGAVVRKLLESFDGMISYTLIQADSEAWKQALGEGNVEEEAASASHGARMILHLGANFAEPQCYAIKVKDGDFRAIILVPNGQVVSSLELTLQRTDTINVPISISCMDDGDGSGDCILIYTDDGVYTNADATLTALSVGSCTLSPTFSASTHAYATTTTNASETVSATKGSSAATLVLTVNGESIASGGSASLKAGLNVIKAVVTNGRAQNTYTINVTKS